MALKIAPELTSLLDEARQTRLEHRAARRPVDAAAAAVRETALKDALAAVVASSALRGEREAPRDGTKILACGFAAGEINGPKETPEWLVISWRGGETDYPGYDTEHQGYHWSVEGTDGYAVWFQPHFWLPLPQVPDISARPKDA